MRVFAFPKTGIAYNESFYRAVEAAGVQVIEGVFSGRWLLRHLRSDDVAHFHWPAFAYGGAASPIALWMRFVRFISLLLLIRAKGVAICWTAHNLLPHDRATIAYVDLLARKVVIRLCSRIFVHGPSAAQLLKGLFPSCERKLVQIEHGHWIDYYPNYVSREDARRKLGVSPQTFVYLFIGLCKEYKNIEGLVEAFQAMSGDVALLIAGKFQNEAYRSKVEDLARKDGRVRLDPGFIADGDLQYYLSAADVVVAPYRDVLTSGTAMLALSFGRPLVSVAIAFLLDVITERSGILYDPSEPSALRRALQDAREKAFDPQTILSEARRFSWDVSAGRFLAALA